jgi:hypothetical protein
MSVLIRQEHIAKLLGVDNQGHDINDFKSKSKFLEAVHDDLFPKGTHAKQYGKAKHMKEEFNIAFRIIIASFVTREGGKDSVPIPHRHFVWFMFRKIKINLAKMLFDHLCTCISESHNKAKVIIHHPRLISELIWQTKLIEILRTKEKLRVFNSAKLDATILVNMKLRTKEETVKIRNPLQEVCESYFWCNGFPTKFRS